MRKLIRGLLPALMLALLPLAAPASVAIGISVNFAPPALPVYVQPEIPAPGYIWTPGYWAWGPGGYYWVPGTWVLPPAVGFLWTPGYWGWAGGAYFWHAGYWGPHVGFYGGINYGCGYYGAGYEGGYWRGNRFLYNTSVNNVHNISVTNVYTRPVVHTAPVSRASFNGGAGGIMARPSPSELSAVHERHVGFTGAQREHQTLAQGNNALRASVNGGRPPIAATARPAAFTGPGVVSAHAPLAYPGDGSARYFAQHAPQAAAGGHSPYPSQHSGAVPHAPSAQYPAHAAPSANPQSFGRAPPAGHSGAPAAPSPQYPGHAPYTAQYAAHPAYAGAGQSAGHGSYAGQPGGSAGREPQGAPGHAGIREPHGEAPGRR